MLYLSFAIFGSFATTAMKQTADIRFLGISPSPALHAMIKEHCAKLDLFCRDLIACRVFVELADKHQRHGRQFNVRIDLTLPGHELTVNRARSEDVYGALHDAFGAMTRRIEDTVRRDRHRRDGPTPGIAEEHPMASPPDSRAAAPSNGSLPC